MPEKDTIVVDLDGTLSDCSARQHLVVGKKRDYEAFHARLHEDPVVQWCRAMVWWAHRSGMRVALVTARLKSLEGATRSWLEKHSVDFHDLVLLRGEDMDVSARELKRDWLVSYGPGRVLFAVDDDPRNAAMFKAEGVPCLLAPGWGDFPGVPLDGR